MSSCLWQENTQGSLKIQYVLVGFFPKGFQGVNVAPVGGLVITDGPIKV